MSPTGHLAVGFTAKKTLFKNSHVKEELTCQIKLI
jgi:hypothetical protein